jgi:hypothetical protein
MPAKASAVTINTAANVNMVAVRLNLKTEGCSGTKGAGEYAGGGAGAKT